MVTYKDIAKATGKSVSTVSMILSGRGDRYNIDTQKRIRRAAEEMGFKPDIAARALRLKKSFLLGVHVSADSGPAVAGLIEGVCHGLRGGDYSPLVFVNNSLESEVHSIERCLERRVDAMLVNCAVDSEGSVSTEAYKKASEAGIPMVEIWGHYLSLLGVRNLDIDHVELGASATRHLLELGHRHIAFLTHERYDRARGKELGPHVDAWEQFCGHRDVMVEAGLEPRIMTHSIPYGPPYDQAFFEGGIKCGEELSGLDPRPTAVVCYNDCEAWGLLRACRLQGLSVPAQLSVVGYGDRLPSRNTEPPLTTYKAPAWDVGVAAAYTALRLIEGLQPQLDPIIAHFVPRQSTASVAS
jgi:LacI family transcriptional regulator